jgi:hypothetical protein
MYKPKNEIIEQIQSYHKQVAELYYKLYEKIEDQEVKVIVYDLYKHEKFRAKYLDKHKKIAEVMNCWLNFPDDKLSNQISDCFNNLVTSELTMEEILKLELHFDNCLIKLYNILASENELSETLANTFYYMLKKTKKEETILANMLHNSQNKLHEIMQHPPFCI